MQSSVVQSFFSHGWRRMHCVHNKMSGPHLMDIHGVEKVALSTRSAEDLAGLALPLSKMRHIYCTPGRRVCHKIAPIYLSFAVSLLCFYCQILGRRVAGGTFGPEHRFLATQTGDLRNCSPNKMTSPSSVSPECVKIT